MVCFPRAPGFFMVLLIIRRQVSWQSFIDRSIFAFLLNLLGEFKLKIALDGWPINLDPALAD
jgi:hypothetical protein